MRTIPANLQAILDSETSDLIRLFQITRRDGTIIRFTDNDVDVPFGGFTFQSDLGFTASAILVAAGTASQGLSLDVVFGSGGFERADIESGAYDEAACMLWAIDRTQPDDEVILFGGRCHQATATNEEHGKLVIRSLASTDRYIADQAFSPTCRADLGDSRCTVDIDALKETGLVEQVGSPAWTPSRLNFRSSTLIGDTGEYALGVVRFTSGRNSGIAVEVARSILTGITGALYNVIYLAVSLPFPLAAGDAFELYPGCDKSIDTCHERYDNAVNFRGEPYFQPEDNRAAG